MDKMNINLNNYEAYFLDYHEGSLSPDLVEELMEFLEKNPQLKEEFEGFESITLKDTEEIKYEGKEILKRQNIGVNPSNFDEFAIEYLEGTLPINLQNELEHFVNQNPGYKRELELYARAKLTLDTSIIFEDKLSLKRRAKYPAAWYYWSAAASVAVIIGTYFLLNKKGAPDGNNIVKHNQIHNSDIVVKHITKSIDTTLATPKITPNNPVNNVIKNNAVVINSAPKKQHNKRTIVPDNLEKDSSLAVVNKGTNNNQAIPVKEQITIPTHNGNDSLTLNGNLSDTSSNVRKPLIKQNISNANQPEIVTAEIPKKKKNKFLIFLVTLTCKGLHKITGQHIKLGKHYDSDTANIIAYQLDLGNKKIQFPVKE
jgi:hypothetical protein